MGARAHHCAHGSALRPSQHGAHLDSLGPVTYLLQSRGGWDELEEQGVVV